MWNGGKRERERWKLQLGKQNSRSVIHPLSFLSASWRFPPLTVIRIPARGSIRAWLNYKLTLSLVSSFWAKKQKDPRGDRKKGIKTVEGNGKRDPPLNRSGFICILIKLLLQRLYSKRNRAPGVRQDFPPISTHFHHPRFLFFQFGHPCPGHVRQRVILVSQGSGRHLIIVVSFSSFFLSSIRKLRLILWRSSSHFIFYLTT